MEHPIIFPHVLQNSEERLGQGSYGNIYCLVISFKKYVGVVALLQLQDLFLSIVSSLHCISSDNGQQPYIDKGEGLILVGRDFAVSSHRSLKTGP